MEALPRSVAFSHCGHATRSPATFPFELETYTPNDLRHHPHHSASSI